MIMFSKYDNLSRVSLLTGSCYLILTNFLTYLFSSLVSQLPDFPFTTCLVITVSFLMFWLSVSFFMLYIVPHRAESWFPNVSKLKFEMDGLSTNGGLSALFSLVTIHQVDNFKSTPLGVMVTESQNDLESFDFVFAVPLIHLIYLYLHLLWGVLLVVGVNNENWKNFSYITVSHTVISYVPLLTKTGLNVISLQYAVYCILVPVCCYLTYIVFEQYYKSANHAPKNCVIKSRRV